MDQLERKREALLKEMQELEAAKQKLISGEANKTSKVNRDDGVKDVLGSKDDDVYNILKFQRGVLCGGSDV